MPFGGIKGFAGMNLLTMAMVSATKSECLAVA
jgi:hypothetical protein